MVTPPHGYDLRGFGQDFTIGDAHVKRSQLAKLFVLATALVTFSTASSVFAVDKKVETAAKELQRKAIEEDNLATNYDAAAKKLQQAVTKCAGDKCEKALKGALNRDLGAMLLLAGKKDEGIAAFIEALTIDPTLVLDASYKTAALDREWESAKKKAGIETVPEKPEKPVKPTKPTKPTTPPVEGAIAGDFQHTPASGQAVRTPLPIYVEYAGEEKVTKVKAKYKGFGMTDWKTLDLAKVGDGYGAMIPCADVTVGDFKYYIQGINTEGDLGPTSGDRNNAFHVKIVNELDEGATAPHLPGQEAPAQCKEASDCPPNFPGCKKEGPVGPVEGSEELRAEGDACEFDNQCKSKKCNADKCTAPDDRAKFARFWVGVAGDLSFTAISAQTSVCSLDPSKSASNPPPLNPGYACVDPATGGDYPLTADQSNALSPTQGNKIKSGGFVFGNIRALASFDYALNRNFMLGGRFGYVFNTFPGRYVSTSFAPVHVELRGSYAIGDNALGKAGYSTVVHLGVGVSQYDGKVTARVVETDPLTGSTAIERDVNAWQVTSPFFFSVGAAARYAFTPRVATSLGLKFVGAVGGGGFMPSLAPELGVQFGF